MSNVTCQMLNCSCFTLSNLHHFSVSEIWYYHLNISGNWCKPGRCLSEQLLPNPKPVWFGRNMSPVEVFRLLCLAFWSSTSPLILRSTMHKHSLGLRTLRYILHITYDKDIEGGIGHSSNMNSMNFDIVWMIDVINTIELLSVIFNRCFGYFRSFILLRTTFRLQPDLKGLRYFAHEVTIEITAMCRLD